MTVNDVTQAVQGVINGVSATGIVATLGVSALLLLIALVLLGIGKRWWLSLGFGLVGLAAALTALLIVEVQTYTSRESESVTVTRPRYRERTRSLARGAMIGLPSAALLVGVGAWASARRRLRKSVPALVKAGRLQLFSKEFGAAVATFSRVIRISPYLAEAYCCRGAAYQGLGDIDHALADFNQAIQYDPRLAHAFTQRARIRTETGDLDGALADLSRLMELQPCDPELYLNRGICYFRKELLAEAAADFHRVLKLTNHSDFAEPAKDYLRQLDQAAVGFPHTVPLPPPPQVNGVPGSDALPEPKARDLEE